MSSGGSIDIDALKTLINKFKQCEKDLHTLIGKELHVLEDSQYLFRRQIQTGGAITMDINKKDHTFSIIDFNIACISAGVVDDYTNAVNNIYMLQRKVERVEKVRKGFEDYLGPVRVIPPNEQCK